MADHTDTRKKKMSGKKKALIAGGIVVGVLLLCVLILFLIIRGYLKKVQYDPGDQSLVTACRRRMNPLDRIPPPLKSINWKATPNPTLKTTKPRWPMTRMFSTSCSSAAIPGYPDGGDVPIR